jgi:hypothetical protein
LLLLLLLLLLPLLLLLLLLLVKEPGKTARDVGDAEPEEASYHYLQLHKHLVIIVPPKKVGPAGTGSVIAVSQQRLSPTIFCLLIDLLLELGTLSNRFLLTNLHTKFHLFFILSRKQPCWVLECCDNRAD